MPQGKWIKDAEMIPENTTYKVDASGRVIIPSYLRNKFGISVGDKMEYYTTFADNSWFLCVRLDKKAEEEKKNEEDI